MNTRRSGILALATAGMVAAGGCKCKSCATERGTEGEDAPAPGASLPDGAARRDAAPGGPDGPPQDTVRPGERDNGRGAAAMDNASDPGAVERIVGTLRGGMAGIGGEHTGWVVERDGKTIEVDMFAVYADAVRLDGQRVAVTGRMTEKGYVERGPVRVLVAERVEAEN